MLDKSKFEKYLYIKDNVVYTKKPAQIIFDLTEYKNISEEFDSDEGIEEVSTGVYEIPGYFELLFPNDNDSIKFFFPYNVYLIETEDNIITSTRMEINYEEDSPVFYAKFKKEETNIKILDKLFENGIKYLSNDLNLLVNSIWKQILPTMNLPYHNIETLLTNLFIKYENNQYKPVRLTRSQEYKKEYAVNTKKSAHLLNDTLGFLYGYSNDALLTNVINNQNNKIYSKNGGNSSSMSSIESLITGDYFNPVEKSDKSDTKEKQ